MEASLTKYYELILAIFIDITNIIINLLEIGG